MAIEFHYTDILNILNNFSNCTNLIASFHFDNKDAQEKLIEQKNSLKPTSLNQYDRAASEHFCTYIHSDFGIEKCHSSDDFYKNEAREKRETIVYGCFAGLCETITPVILDNIIVGYIMLGKFVDAEQQYSNREKLIEFAQNNNLDVEKICALYDELPVVSSIQLEASLSLLNMSISHILETKMINLKAITLLEQIKSYINTNYGSTITVESICNKFFVSRQALFLIFKNNLGIPLKQYITNVQLEKAKELLLTTNKNMEQIAVAVGFPNYNYFIRRFRERLGISPLQFRKKNSPPTNK